MDDNKNKNTDIAFMSALHYFAMKNTGEYRLELDVSEGEFANVMGIIKLLHKPFKMVLVVDDKKASVDNAFLFRFMINKDGDSRVIISFANDTFINDDMFVAVNSSVEKIIHVYVKVGS